MCRPAGWYAARSVRSRKLMSVRVSGWPAVRHSRWLSATAGAISALPVGYDHLTRTFDDEVPGRKGLCSVEHRDRVQQHPIACGRPLERSDVVERQLASGTSLRHPAPTLYRRVPTSNVTSDAGLVASEHARAGGKRDRAGRDLLDRRGDRGRDCLRRRHRVARRAERWQGLRRRGAVVDVASRGEHRDADRNARQPLHDAQR